MQATSRRVLWTRTLLARFHRQGRWGFGSLIAALAIATTCLGQPQVVAPVEPVPIGGFADVEIRGLENPESMAYSVVPSTRVRVYSAWGSSDPILAIATNQPGTWTIVVAAIEGDKVWQQAVPLVIGDGVKPDPIDPDIPTPPVPPDPIEAGKRTLLLIRETADSTPAMRSLVTLLRTGTNAEYLRSKGHELAILDDDTVGPDGQPAPVLEAWRQHFAGMSLPVLILIDQQTGELVHKLELPATATAADVIAALKEHGG